MEAKRTFVIGDIHGCLDMFKRLMEKIDWRPAEDSLIFLGDYIDRGKDSKGVVDFIVDLSRRAADVRGLMGNHEFMFLDYLAGRNRKLYFVNGGGTTLRSYWGLEGQSKDLMLPPEHRSFFDSLEMYIELPDYYLVHAGFLPGTTPGEQNAEDMVWIRDQFIYSDHDFGKKVIFGHTPFYEPFISHNKIGLDTGAVYGGRLTCLQLPELKFYSVAA